MKKEEKEEEEEEEEVTTRIVSIFFLCVIYICLASVKAAVYETCRVG